jgi:DNA-binding FadR family transcriptional regulator
VDALRAGDGAWAESVMRSHVLAARAVLLDSHRDERVAR